MGTATGGVKETRFPSLVEYRDLPFTAFFVLHLLVTIILFGVGLGKYNHGNTNNTNNTNNGNFTTRDENASGSGQEVAVGDLILAIFLCSLFGAAFATGWIFLLRKFAGTIVYLSLALALGSYIVSAIIWMALGVVPVGIVFLIIACINLFLFYWWRDRIEFAKHVLKCVAEIVDQFPSTVYVGIASLIPMVCCFALFFYTLLFLASFPSPSTFFLAHHTPSPFSLFVCLFVFF
jgi:hypothetical protein